MKKKMIIALVAILLLALAGMGTIAYFSKSFSSDDNVATAAKFTVDVVNSEGVTIGNADFNLGDVLFPGMEQIEAYSFQIKKNDTEVPVEYQVNLTPSGELFPAGNSSPIVLTMQRQINNDWVNIDYANPFKLENDTDSFRILVTWPHGSNDIAFQGKTGNIHLEVIATQVDKMVPGDINATVANTTKGEAASEGAKTIVSYRFDQVNGGQFSDMTFHVNDGDGVEVNTYKPLTYNFGKKRRNTTVEMASLIASQINTSATTAPKFAALRDKFTIASVGNEVVMTSIDNKAYNNFSIVVPETETISGAFVVKNAGSTTHNGIKEVNTLTINGDINDGGAFNITFSDGTETVTKAITVTKTDTHATIAAKIALEFSGLSGWDVTNATGSADVVFTAKTANADKDVSITITK